MAYGRHLVTTLLVSCFLVLQACSQIQTVSHLPADYVGSTPCDSLIRSTLQIPATETCEFIKWELRLPKHTSDPFQLSALYGESQPNTNGFKGGGKTITISGTYTVTHGAKAHPQGNVYQLKGNNLQPEIILIEMDTNILHFADGMNHLIVGNAGYGYVLNKVQK